MKIVIVGGVAGGATAAARIRRLDEQAEIVVFEQSGYISYANCGLPYYIGGVIRDPGALTLQTPGSFFSRFRVNMKVRHEVTAIHPENKTVSVKNLETGETFEEGYDKLLLSPGATPTQPRLPGVGLEKVFTLRMVEDTFRIKEYINTRRPRSAVLAGGGFIGLELAENLRELGLEVTIVQRPKQLMNPFDPDMAAFIHSEVRRHGVKLVLGRTVEGFEEWGSGVDVLLKEEAPLHADMVVLAIGVTPDTALAREAGLELGLKGSIVVNDRMETSAPDVYAVGDAVQVKHSVTGQDALISLAGPANRQGRIAADNICGGDSRYPGSQGSSVIKVFGMTAAVTGVNETNAKKAGLETDKVILSPMSHAGYYPGGKVMTIKVIFGKETYRLLGAQIVGYEGVDKRIDVLAAAIHAGMKADELAELDLAYAPPYSSAKDPVNMAGFMIDNIRKGVHQYTCAQYGKVPIGTLCPTQHRINESVVLDLISGMLRAIADYAKSDRAAFIREVQEAQASQQDSDIKKKKRRLTAAQKRAGELERLVCKIYEDNALGRLPDARYAALDAQYAKEQEELSTEIAELETAINSYDQGKKSAEKFIALIDKYSDFDTMTTTMLNEFVDKILVHERDRKGSIETTQAVEVYFNFVGKYIPPAFRKVELTPEEQEAIRKKEELKDKRHQAYLRRKASGWQRQYEERTRAAKKAKVDAGKAAIRAEDMAKGIYAHVADLPHQEPKRAAMQVRPTL